MIDPDEPIALCRKCRRACYYWYHGVDIGGGEIEILTDHWSHFVHPDDDHDAEPSVIPNLHELLEELREQAISLSMLTCPYYQKIPGGTCSDGGCWQAGEPMCMTGEPAEGWIAPPGWTPEKLKAEAERRQREGRRP